MSKKDFLSEFLKGGKHVGSVTPSSKFLVKKMVDPIDFESVSCIVEFGPGTGIITQELLNRMPKNATLLAFEINTEFCDSLKKKISDPRLKVICDSAEKLEDYLRENHIAKADYVVSSIPLALIPNPVVNAVLEVVKKVLNVKGAFIQYQYSLNAYKKLKKTFNNVNLNFTPMNIPPAFVFTCTN
ncbi:MAG: class I SAM-dependent methyltransferase [Bacteroidia bacterium]